MTGCPSLSRLARLLIGIALVTAPAAAHAIALTVHVHFENFGAAGQQAGEADLAGWRVDLETEAGDELAHLGITGANGDTPVYDVAAGTYVAVLTMPDPSPYDPDSFWPTNLRFPFTMSATNPQGQPITSYRLRIGLGCGCNDADSCTTDVCNAGVCSAIPTLRPEVPELCDQKDNDCDGDADEGLPVPCNGNPTSVIGCADGTREGFMDFPAYPYIAACGGAWDQPGLDGAALAPSCGRIAGNHSANKPGSGCRASDLCAVGWHVCRGPEDLAMRASGNICAAAVDENYPSFGAGDFGVDASGALEPLPGGAFFVARGVLGQSCVDAVNGLPPASGGIFGCGNLGLDDTRCGAFSRAAGTRCAGLRDLAVMPGDNPATDWAYDTEADWAWSCTGAVGAERDRLVKRLPDRQGGVLCCRDAAPGLTEVCDGIDNDADGATDDLAAGRAGQSCPLDDECGTWECTVSGGLSCEDPGLCDDTTCNGIDEDEDGLTDEEYVPSDTSCGVGACRGAGELTCDDGDELDSCVTLPKAEASDLTCDGEDGDCDGLTDEDWTDAPTSCGMGVCASTGTRRCVGGVPTNSCVVKPPLDSSDDNCNDVDEDCNGEADEDYPSDPTSCGDGVCASTGELTCIGGEVTNTCTEDPPRGADDATCDGEDDDCDGATDEEYTTHESTCGEGACRATGTATCVGGDERNNCLPLDPPSPDDANCDGFDDDCSGEADEDFSGAASSVCGVGACERQGSAVCIEGVESEECTPGEPAADDATCDGADDDCNGATDEDFDATATTCGVGACEGNRGTTSCASGELTDSCDPLDGATSETCDGEDEDCDGDTDEDFGVVGGPCDGDDEDECENGTLACTTDHSAAACDETSESQVDVCNGLDDDCDGETDEGLAECSDSDDDTIPDPADNCARTPNTDQLDGDEDGVGDVCDVLIQSGGGDCSGGPVSAWSLLAALAFLLRRRA